MLPNLYGTFIEGYANDISTFSSVCPSDVIANSTSPIPSTGALIAYSLLLLGGYIRVMAQYTLGKHYTWEISVKPDHKLFTYGPYSYIRHPGYLGIWIIRIACDILLSSQGTFLRDCVLVHYPLLVNLFVWQNYLFTASLIVYMVKRALYEDVLMKEMFGDKWEKWAQKTRYRIVPFVF